MARFNLADYETVEDRIKKFYAAHEDGRIITEWQDFDGYIDRKEPATYAMKAFVYLTAGDQANGLPKATGYAVEIDGTGGANNGSAMENAETSAIGRALANMNLSGNKRASREEMQKVERTQVDYLAELEKATTVEAVRDLYSKAVRSQQPKDVLETIKAKGEKLK
jgi:hypothetical protein